MDEDTLQFLCQSAKVKGRKVHIFHPNTQSLCYRSAYQISAGARVEWHGNTAATAKDLTPFLNRAKEDGDVLWVWGPNSPFCNELIKQQDVPFEVWSTVRSDTGWWQRTEHIGSLPIGKFKIFKRGMAEADYGG